MKYKAIKSNTENTWELWQIDYENGSKFLCCMTLGDILQIFNETVPETIEEPFITGDPDCIHSWRPWAFNGHFIQCSKCSAMKRVKRLVPREYK